MIDAPVQPPVESPESEDDRDRRLLARFLDGEQSAFDDLVSLHGQQIMRLASRLLGWSSDVEDVVQDVFVIVFTKAHQFRGEARFLTWLTRIVVNRCRTELRRRQFRLLTLSNYAARRECHPGPGARSDEAGDTEAVRLAIRNLPANYREDLVLHYYEELTAREIAESVRASVTAVEVRLHRARKILKCALSGNASET